MGLLDDAIREHLDLKRRRGSDPTEVARLEQEALGPVRREPEPDAAAGDQPHEEPAAEDRVAAEHHEPAAQQAPDPRDSDIVHQPTTEFRVEDHHDEEDDARHGQPAAPPAQEESLWADDLDEEPSRHEEPAGDADEDVLEETPEFLQETPEHDRLWFEQRPPRDFDFDG